MSRRVEWGGKYYDRGLFDPPLNPPPGVCPRCGGSGVVAEQIDEDRCDVAVPCFRCQMFCKPCNDWVKREGHTCKGEAKP